LAQDLKHLPGQDAKGTQAFNLLGLAIHRQDDGGHLRLEMIEAHWRP
jgi:hypothetical protein